MAAVLAGVAPAARADQVTAGGDNLRTSWDRNEPGLSPAAVQSSVFGQLFRTQLDGQVYAQPLVIGDEVVALTENDTAYGLDAATGAVRWHVHYGTPFQASSIGCGDLTPTIGATATPVYDPATGTLYFTTKVADGTAADLHPTWLMHAVDATSGAERPGWPVTIAGTATNQPGGTFDPFHEMQRPGLLLLDGVVYAGFGAHCDVQPYRGYVVGVSTTTHSITSMWASEAGASTSGAGVWQSGGGLVSDGSGRIFFSTGNGISPSPGPGSSPPGTLAESVVRLQVGSDGSLTAADYFSPTNNATLDLNDQDISSGAPLAVPDGYGTAAHPHLMVEQGKDGRVFLLDRDHLGGTAQGNGGGDDVLGVSGPYQGQWGHPAFFGGDGGYVYLVGNNGPLRALHLGVGGDGLPALTQTGQTQDVFGYTSGSPLVTSDGTTDGSGVVWTVSASNAAGANGTLRAYSATPDGNGLLQLLWSAPIGNAAKFATPTAAAGRVYVGTRDGFLYGFGSPAATALTAAPVDFGPTAVGGTAQGTLQLTATVPAGVTVTGASTAAPFAIGPTPPAFPATVANGQTLSLPVQYTPTATGGANGAVKVSLSDGSNLVFALHGVGTRPGLGAAPASLDFGEVPTGTSLTMNVQLTNTGTVTETVGAATAPTGPFQAAGLPAAGTQIAPGGSVVVTVVYTPQAAQQDTGSLAVTSTDGTVTVPLTGTGVAGHGHLALSTATTNFGAVPVGASRTLSFTLTNDGNIPVTVTKAKAPTGDYNSAVGLSEGLVIGPGQSAVQQVTFTPRSSGTLTAAYEITGDGVDAAGAPQGAMYEQLTGVGQGTADVAGVQTGAWTVNGSASLPGDGSIQLTGAVGGQAGSAYLTRPLRTDGLRATFTAKLGQGTGGDGLAFDLLDPALGRTTALGTGGAGVGAAGVPAVVVKLGTTPDGPIAGRNDLAVALATPGSGALHYVAWTGLPNSLRQGTHQVDVQVTGGQLSVWLDGVQRLTWQGYVPSAAYVGFSGGTGALNDVHAVSGVVVGGGAAAGYVPVTPGRALATWAGAGRPGTTPLAAGATASVVVGGAFGVPAGASSVLVEVQAASPSTSSGSLTVLPHGGTAPAHGVLSWNATGQNVARTAVVPLGTGGRIDVVNSSRGSVHAALYVLGYTMPGAGSGFTPVPPVFDLDTARAVGQHGTAALAPHGTLNVKVAGVGGVPATARSVVVNLTASRASADASVTAYPQGGARPGFGNVYVKQGGDLMSDLLTVPVGANGGISLYNWGGGSVALTAVVVGWYGPAGGVVAPASGFVSTTPKLLLDTAAGVGQTGTGRLAAGGTVTMAVSGAGVPAGARAVLVDLDADGSAAGGSLTAWPANGVRPATTAFFWSVPGHLCGDLALVPLDSSGRIAVRNNGSAPTALHVQVLGYFS
ncbi:choice-of-anchor D domain-containing protein [Streptacidiphilus anmyonensis]|uniref:choice-of-anchor D domain-containing protein n=1 Tax=Streptacidiphilus anmyonensis TaxID=405782 RepID=UPI000693C445